ncbi:type IV pilin protein [Psychrobacter sp. Ps3]|uniref:type IV pilin protein n=1 Tax=Psychrobacter sp. Ps3 TaxID=2790957 RepID=UPI0023DFD6C0|nr:type IV pilin protein [Psychrobacter sp. Ps3]
MLALKTSMQPTKQVGFTLIELMIVVAVIAVLASIAYPSYQSYVIKSKRADMMSEMHNIASEIEARKLAQGSYSAISAAVTSEFDEKGYPTQGEALYEVSVTPDPLTAKWQITAETIDNTQVDGDGDLSLNYQGIKCRMINSVNTCGSGDEWN